MNDIPSGAVRAASPPATRWLAATAAGLSLSVLLGLPWAGAGAQQAQTVPNLSPAPVGYWDGAPTISIADLRALMERYGAQVKKQEAGYKQGLEDCMRQAGAGTGQAGAPLVPAAVPGGLPGAMSAAPDPVLAQKSDADLLALVQTGNMAAVTEMSRRAREAQVKAMTGSGSSPEIAEAMRKYQAGGGVPARPAPKATAPAQKTGAGGSLTSGLAAQLGQSVAVGRDPNASACLSQQKDERVEKPFAGIDNGAFVLDAFDKSKNPRGMAVVLYAGNDTQGPVNVVDPAGPWGKRIERIDRGVKRALDYDNGYATRPADETQRMLYPLQPPR